MPSNSGMMNFVLTKRFWPLFLTQFFGAANDNFLKNAMLMMITFQLGRSESETGTISNLAAALFILPFFLFSTLAGQFADRFDRSKYTQIVKLVEVVLMLGAVIGFVFMSLPILLTVLFFMGSQSAFFSPAKYSLLPYHLKGRELLAGNAWISGGTYIAILAGAMGGGLTIAAPNGNYWCGLVLVVCSLFGWLSSRSIPLTPSTVPNLKIDWNIFRQAVLILRNDVWRQVTVRFCVYVVAVFWLAGSLYITQLSLFTKNYVGGNEAVCTFFFALFSIGVGLGSALANAIFRKRIRFGLIAFASVAMGLFSMDLAVLVWTNEPRESILSFHDLLRSTLFYRTSFDLLLIAVFGGIWSVPLNTILQKSSRPEVLARAIAGGNIVNSFYMAAGAVCVAVLMKIGVDTGAVFAGLGVILISNTILVFKLKSKMSVDHFD